MGGEARRARKRVERQQALAAQKASQIIRPNTTGRRESLFIDEMESLHASGGDLNEGAPLCDAARRGWCAAVRWLITHGADVQRPPYCSWTPLRGAARGGSCAAAILLLNAGARVDDRDDRGWTALHDAASGGYADMCKLLLSRGASLDVLSYRDPKAYARNYRGRDPEACARSNARPHVRPRTCAATVDLLVAVRAAGGWRGYVAASQRDALLVLRRALPALRARGAATPSRERLFQRLFVDIPEDVFTAVFAYWS